MKLTVNLCNREEMRDAIGLLERQLSMPQVGDIGSAAAPAPLAPPAPSTAGATPWPTAPVGPLASLPPLPDLSLNASTAPATAAPTGMPPAPPPAGAPIVERDSKGLPWDARIHASTKTKNADGQWKARKGADPVTVAAVTAELQAGAPVVSTAMPLPILTAQPDALSAASVFGGTPPPVSSAVADPTTFEQLMTRVSPSVASGAVPPTAINAAAQAQGVASLVMLQQNPAYVPYVWATLKQQYPVLQ